MTFMKWRKDGGPESTVEGFFLIEIKSLFSIVLLKFSDGSRDAFHSHAFNCFSWVLRGKMLEYHRDWTVPNRLPKGSRLIPFTTLRTTFHKVVSRNVSWVLTFRGPWSKSWEEYLPESDESHVLTDGRVVSEVI